MGRCPSCGRGSIMKTWFRAHETCPTCAARFERGEGTWIGSTVFGYAIVATVGIGGGILLIAFDAYSYGRLLAVLALSALLTVAVFPLQKIAWIHVLHQMGKVYPDPPGRDRQPHVG